MVIKNMIGRVIAVIIVLCAIGYILWPLDVLPDIIPIFGWIDDLFIGLIGVVAFFKGVVGK